MENNGVLPDTCAWIEYFRDTGSRLNKTLENLILNEHVFMCGPVLYELSQGIKSAKEKKAVLDAMRALKYIDMSESLWIKAGELSASLRKEGKTIPFSDILIAALAMENNLALLTIDKHFNIIKKLKQYR